jgi:uncharacterized membrane protein HdeD (DUF308 family)
MNSAATADANLHPNADAARGSIAPALQKRWGWMLTSGIVQLIGGLVAIAAPAVASLVAAGFFSAILLVSAAFNIIHAFKVRKWTGFALHLLGGLLYAAAGIIVLIYPFGGLATLMLVLGVLFIVDGAVRSMLAAALRPRDGWGWFLAAGIMSIGLGVMLLTMWPAGALWIVGMLLGINLLFSGILTTIFAVQCRRRASVSISTPAPTPA